jgi:nitroimidazol reductase NimA-like FMN-containing flavoprotein (pyridoxamine 5'-phosphate oxidase superfamily)
VVFAARRSRTLRDRRWQELTDVECHRLLAERHLGRPALTDPDGPLIFPVNYAVDAGAVVFRTDPGSKLDALAGGARVAFEVDAVDEGNRTGWSVVIRGQAAEVTEPADLGRLRRLPLYPWAPGAKARYVRIRPVSITGRRIAIPANLAFTWWG